MKIGEYCGDLTGNFNEQVLHCMYSIFHNSQNMMFKGKFILWGCNNTKRFYIVDMILKVCIHVYMMYICTES